MRGRKLSVDYAGRWLEALMAAAITNGVLEALKGAAATNGGTCGRKLKARRYVSQAVVVPWRQLRCRLELLNEPIKIRNGVVNARQDCPRRISLNRSATVLSASPTVHHQELVQRMQMTRPLAKWRALKVMRKSA